MPNEKSSSSVSSNRFFCVSVITLYASCFVSVGVRSGISSRCSLPCTRTCGGVLIDRCRSEPCRSIVVFKSSGNVGGILCPFATVQKAESRGHFLPSSLFPHPCLISRFPALPLLSSSDRL